MKLGFHATWMLLIASACGGQDSPHDAPPLPTLTATTEPITPLPSSSAASSASAVPSASAQVVVSASVAPSSSVAPPETLTGTVAVKSIVAAWAANSDKAGDRMLLGFRRCYSKGLESDPAAAGDVRIQANIGANGEVISAKLMKPSTLPIAVQDCMASRVASAMFSPPPAAPGFLKVTIHCDPH